MTIAVEIRELIEKRLQHLEQKHDLSIVFACESGSRAWGFASENSDYDVRFVFVRPVLKYIRLRPATDAFDEPCDDDIDAAGWDIRKTCELLLKSNAALLEWLASPVIYRKNHEVAQRLIALREQFFCPKKTVFHYLSLATNQWNNYIDGNASPVRKKYLYLLRPLACMEYIRAHMTMPPTAFADVLTAIDWPGEVMASVERIIEQKKAGQELDADTADQSLNAFCAEELERGRTLGESLEPRKVDTSLLDDLIEEAIAPKTQFRE